MSSTFSTTDIGALVPYTPGEIAAVASRLARVPDRDARREIAEALGFVAYVGHEIVGGHMRAVERVPQIVETT